MRGIVRNLAPFASMLAVGAIVGTGLSGVPTAGAVVAGRRVAVVDRAHATATPTCGFANLPSQCGYDVTVTASGSVVITTGSGVPYDAPEKDDVTVGIVNDSDGTLDSVTLTSAGTDAFGFDGDGPCTVPPTTACNGPTTYEGPGVSFSNYGSATGNTTATVSFSPGLAPQATAYFALEEPPTSGGSATITAPIAASSVAVGPFTTGVRTTVVVAKVTGGAPDLSPSGLVATINWGDGSRSSRGSVSGGNGVFLVKGRHSYASHGTQASPVTVLVTGPGSAVESVTDNRAQVGDAVAECTGGICIRSLAKQEVQVQLTTANSKKGFLLISTDPNAGTTGLNCGDPFRHAPSIITGSDTFVVGSSAITATDVFKEIDARGGPGSASKPFAVCFQGNQPFKDASGEMVHLGLLATCPTSGTVTGPCVDSIKSQDIDTPNDAVDNDDATNDTLIVEKITYPTGDPRYG